MAVRSPGAVRRLPGEPTAESAANGIGHITLGAKRAGEPGAGDPHAGFDEAGAGDVAMGAGLRPEAKAEDEPPDPTVRAPVLDPTGGVTVQPSCISSNRTYLRSP